jgi:ABC-2 type transport system permease protein
MAGFTVWWRLVTARVRAGWQYRASFALFMLSQALVMTLDLGVIAAIFSQVDTLDGWSGVEVALLFGLGGVGFGLADAIVSQVELATTHLKAGTFDLFLLRPVSPFLHLTASEFELRRVGRGVQPLVVLVIALAVAPIDWSPAVALLVPVTVLSGVVLFGSVWVVTSSLAFWTVESQEIGNAFTYGGNVATSYPLDLLGTWLRRLFTFVVPLALMTTYPAEALLGRLEGITVVYSLLGTAALAAVSRGVWLFSLRRYSSASS